MGTIVSSQVSSHAGTLVEEESEIGKEHFVVAGGESKIVRVGEILACLEASYIFSSVSSDIRVIYTKNLIK